MVKLGEVLQQYSGNSSRDLSGSVFSSLATATSYTIMTVDSDNDNDNDDEEDERNIDNHLNDSN